MRNTLGNAARTPSQLRRLVLTTAGAAIALAIMTGCSGIEALSNKLSNATAQDQTTITSVGNSNSNTIYDGWAAISDGWIYYGTEDGLFKVSEKGGEDENLLAQLGEGKKYCIRNINVVGDWIYYRNFVDGWGSEYKMRTDGSQHQEIVWSGTLYATESGPYVWDHWDGHKIYSLADDFKKDTLVYEGSNTGSIVSGYTMNICEDYAYFCASVGGQKGIYRIKTDGGELELLREGRTDYLVVEGDWLYFAGYREDGLFRMRLDGSNEEQIVSETYGHSTGGSFAVADGWVYYVNPNDRLCRFSPDNGETQVIYEDNAQDINVVGNWVYFTKVEDSSTASRACYRVRVDGSGLQHLGNASRDGLTYYWEKNTMEAGKTYEVVDIPELLDGDFTPISGTYIPYGDIADFSIGDGINYYSKLTIDEKGIANGRVGSQTYAAIEPTSVTRNEDGSYQCVIGAVDGKYQFYVVYPIGVRDGRLDTLRIRIVYHYADGGVSTTTYEQIEQWA